MDRLRDGSKEGRQDGRKQGRKGGREAGWMDGYILADGKTLTLILNILANQCTGAWLDLLIACASQSGQ